MKIALKKHGLVELNILRKDYERLYQKNMMLDNQLTASNKKNETLRHELSKMKIENKLLRERK